MSSRVEDARGDAARVPLADDREVVRQGFRLVVGTQPDYEMKAVGYVLGAPRSRDSSLQYGGRLQANTRSTRKWPRGPS
jgi:hypothetical protein